MIEFDSVLNYVFESLNQNMAPTFNENDLFMKYI